MAKGLQEIREAVERGKTKDALTGLLEWTRTHLPGRRNDATLLNSQFGELGQQFIQGTVTMEEYQVQQARINVRVLQLIDLMEGEWRTDTDDRPAAAQPTLHEYHSYTCDRVDHNDQFQLNLASRAQQRTQFYYLYGGEMQSPEGFFKRVSYHLEGRLLDYLNPGLSSSCRVERLRMTFEFSRQPELYRQNILRSFFAMLGLNPNEHEPLLDRTLAYCLERSPLLSDLGPDDYVCLYLNISQYEWDPQLTPGAARWFIRQFCGGQLSEQQPACLFFFGINYEDDNTTVREQVRQAIAESDDVVTLPEFDMVYRRDIGQWLQRYRQLAPQPRERNELLKNTFGDAEEHYMADVEVELRRIIDNYNNQLL